MEKHDKLEGVGWHCSFIQARWKTAQPGDSWLPILFLTWPFLESEPPPSDPAGRKRGGCSCSSDTMEREEGVTAIEVTQWLELQDTSVKQEGRGSSKPWNPDLLKEASKTAALLEPRGTEVTERLGLSKSATRFLHWKWRVKKTFWGERKMLVWKCNQVQHTEQDNKNMGSKVEKGRGHTILSSEV